MIENGVPMGWSIRVQLGDEIVNVDFTDGRDWYCDDSSVQDDAYACESIQMIIDSQLAVL